MKASKRFLMSRGFGCEVSESLNLVFVFGGRTLMLL